jgi:hypothetical protein
MVMPMKDEDIDAILHANHLRRARPSRRPSPVEAEAVTSLAVIRKKLGVVVPEPTEDDDLALVLAEADGMTSGRTRGIVVSRRHRKIVGEHD